MKPFKTVNGVDIFLSDTGKFSADINGEPVVSPTLAALEKKIVKAPVTKYVPRDALSFSYGERLDPVLILGLKKRSSRSHWGAAYFYLIRNKSIRNWRTAPPTTNTGEQLYEDLEYVHAAHAVYLEEYSKIDKEIELLRDKQRNARNSLFAKIEKFKLPDAETSARELGLLKDEE